LHWLLNQHHLSKRDTLKNQKKGSQVDRVQRTAMQLSQPQSNIKLFLDACQGKIIHDALCLGLPFPQNQS
jgi:hypothetical protein